MSTHPSPQELRRKWKAANAEPAESAARLDAYRELAEGCPAFVPNLLALGRTLSRTGGDTADAGARHAEAERTLRTAVDVSAGAPEPLIELGRFLATVRDTPSDAEGAFASATSAALALLEEAWAGWIDALGRQGKLDAALEVEEQARRILPDSALITRAVEAARHRGVKSV
jgi:tetratricopeptide (TPR) repeat protein